ncbi:hypothetical protein Dda_7305 [Drechslerella dactyloides]|uniref:Methyltransferase n=1 Tax=Drechslerella dactyloides TaxID=74499 RepID=A0AAD6ITT3_DREDA|nr:hypothetical protein Dda_7305 [Drechslerella dactyloides]
MTDSSNARFNSEAETWDLNPDVQAATKSAVKCLLEKVPALSPDNPSKPAILDLGAGTGLLSLALAPHASSILSVDPSSGMISALNAKLAKPDAPQNITPLHALLTSADSPLLPTSPSGGRQRFDLIVSNLVLHHVPDIQAFIKLTFDLLNPGGVIALTDYENTGPEARKFHPEDKIPGVEHHGILRAEIHKMLFDADFVDGSVETGWVMRKPVERFPGEWKDGKPAPKEGEEPCEMDFNFLLIMGRKPTA